MADPIRARVQRHRQQARDHGLVRVDVELPRHLVVALRRADETVKDLLLRALTALQHQVTGGQPPPLPETETPPGEPLPVTPGPAPEKLPETPLHSREPLPETPMLAGWKLPETLPDISEISAKDALLVALLRQEPLLLYAEIAARLGISESQVRHKAAPWAKAGLVPQRPRGGARPRQETP